MVIAVKTSMREMPNTCIDCKFVECKLPIGKSEEFRPECRVMRHEKCPLVKMKEKEK